MRGIDHCEETGDGFAKIVAIKALIVSAFPRLIVSNPVGFIAVDTDILVSLEAAPPAIFCTRRVPSSDLASSRDFFKSSFDLPQSCDVLTLVVDA